MFLQSMLSSEHYIDEKVFYEAVRQYIVSSNSIQNLKKSYDSWCSQKWLNVL